MKKVILSTILLAVFANSFSQKSGDEELKPKGFHVNNVFVGGSITLGYGAGNNSSSNFIIGANPEIGYSVAEWLDAGIAGNAIYSSSKFTQGFRYRQTAFNTGIGAFLRLFPAKGFFIQAQPEQNWIKYTQTNLDLAGSVKITQKVSASSFLVGVGYGQRLVGQSSFFTTILFDLNSDINSPYRDSYGTALPIIRSGFNLYLGRKQRQK